MMSLQVKVACVVTDERGQVLLTRREDLGGWGLPMAWPRGEATLFDTAVRAVQQASGMTARIERAVGLYYWPGMATLTLLTAGSALPGEAFRGHCALFPADALPEMPSHQGLMALDALAGTRHRPRVFDLSAAEQQRLKLGANLRRIRQRLRGQPDAPGLMVDAVGVVMDEGHRRVLTLRRKRTEALPRLTPTGQRPPWDELATLIETEARVPVTLRWVGGWLDAAHARLDLVFAAITLESFDLPGQAEWSLARQVALPRREASFVSRVKPTFARDPVWLIHETTGVQAGDTISGN